MQDLTASFCFLSSRRFLASESFDIVLLHFLFRHQRSEDTDVKSQQTRQHQALIPGEVYHLDIMIHEDAWRRAGREFPHDDEH
eukprot:scaffold17624_cov77-Cyclotella_meneghiniana.AAC.1